MYLLKKSCGGQPNNYFLGLILEHTYNNILVLNCWKIKAETLCLGMGRPTPALNLLAAHFLTDRYQYWWGHGQWHSQGIPSRVGKSTTRRAKMRNEKSLRKKLKNKIIKIFGKMKKVQLLPTRDCEAGYGPGPGLPVPL